MSGPANLCDCPRVAGEKCCQLALLPVGKGSDLPVVKGGNGCDMAVSEGGNACDVAAVEGGNCCDVAVVAGGITELRGRTLERRSRAGCLVGSGKLCVDGAGSAGRGDVGLLSLPCTPLVPIRGCQAFSLSDPAPGECPPR
jgi:hypothetical protein